MPVVSVKVEEKMKKGMEKYRSVIDWPGEIRNFIGSRIQEAERETNFMDVEKLLEAVPVLSKGRASRLVREDRDSSH